MIVILMGVTGTGKTTLGKVLAELTGWPFDDGDDFHSPANIEKMRSGVPLNDADRWPWLDSLNTLLRAAQAKGGSAILACSALKQRYRDRLQQGLEDVRWVYLRGDIQLIRARLQARQGHYMNPALLQSQFDALEPPRGALDIEIDEEPTVLAARVLQGLDPKVVRRNSSAP